MRKKTVTYEYRLTVYKNGKEIRKHRSTSRDYIIRKLD